MGQFLSRESFPPKLDDAGMMVSAMQFIENLAGKCL
jgi:hypothetical protein